MPYKVLQPGIPGNVHVAGAATANGVRFAVPHGCVNHKLTIKSSAGVASGAVQPESADRPSYAGTWNPVGGGPITVPAASSQIEYEFQGAFKSLGARISTIVVGGTIDVTLVSTR